MNVTNKPQESASIRFLTGPLAGNIFQVNKPIITFGRDPGNDVVISDPTVSRKHAHLVNNAGQWSIEKLAEQNVVTVNQQNVQAAVISDRDTIGLGTGTTFLFLKRLRPCRLVRHNAHPWMRTNLAQLCPVKPHLEYRC